MVYLDNSATTAVSDEVAKKAFEMMTLHFGNPSSVHSLGFEAELEIKKVRKTISDALCCREGEIFFTSGGTEANNTAVFGTAAAKMRRGNKIIVSGAEHASTLEAAQYLSQNGFEIVTVAPEKDGSVSPQAISQAVDKKTVLVSVMLVNNETGTINDVATIAAAARRKNSDVIIHCDAVQAFGKIPVHPGRVGADLLTISAHKIHGPKGCGAIFVRKGVKIRPLIFGGEQQNKFRPGTENVPAIASFGVATEIAVRDLAESFGKVKALRDRLCAKLSEIDGVTVNSPENALPYVLNFSTNAVKSETLIHFLEKREIYVSGGSACAKGNRSHVLIAMGLAQRNIDTALRVSFCRYNTESDVDALVKAVAEGIKTLQKI